MQSIEFHYSVGPRLGGCAALLCRGSAGTTPARPPAANTTADRDADGRSPPVADAAASATGARAIPASNRQQLVSRDSAPCGACAGAARCCTSPGTRSRKRHSPDIHVHIPRASYLGQSADSASPLAHRSQLFTVQPYRSITFAGAAHSSTTSEERPPSPTGVTLCLFSEWKSSASPTCGQGQGQVGGLRGACWARQGSLGS